MGFASAVFGGSDPVLSGGIKKAGDVSDFTTGKGKQLTGQAGDMMSTLMSGDPAAMAKLLSPQIGTMTKQGQQQKKSIAEFGTRSGGMASKGQTIDDTTRTNIGNMISSLTGTAIGAGASMGSNLIDTGMKALGQQTDMSHQQMENWGNSIFGSALTSGISTAESFAMGKIPGMPKG